MSVFVATLLNETPSLADKSIAFFIIQARPISLAAAVNRVARSSTSFSFLDFKVAEEMCWLVICVEPEIVAELALMLRPKHDRFQRCLSKGNILHHQTCRAVAGLITRTEVTCQQVDSCFCFAPG